MKPRIRSVCTVAVLSAMLTVAKMSLSFIPNVELVSLLLIIYSLTQGRRVYAIVAVFVTTEFLLYGFNIWSLNYLYIWYILVIIARLFRRIDNTFIWAGISGLFGMLFGAFCAAVYIFLPSLGLEYAFSWWLSGLKFDLIHCIGNIVVCIALYRPMRILFSKIDKYYT